MEKFARLVVSSIERLSVAGAALAGLSLFVVVFFVLYGVVMRYVFRSPTAWAIEFPSFMFLLVIAMTLAYVHRGRGHIGVELLAHKMPPVVQRFLFIVGSVILIVYAAIMTWGGLLKAWDHLQHGERSLEMEIPLVAVQMALPIGLLLLCLQAVVEIGKEVAALKAEKTVAENNGSTTSHSS